MLQESQKIAKLLSFQTKWKTSPARPGFTESKRLSPSLRSPQCRSSSPLEHDHYGPWIPPIRPTDPAVSNAGTSWSPALRSHWHRLDTQKSTQSDAPLRSVIDCSANVPGCDSGQRRREQEIMDVAWQGHRAGTATLSI